MNGRRATRVLVPSALIVATTLTGCTSGSVSSSSTASTNGSTSTSTATHTASGAAVTPSATPTKSTLCATGSLQLVGSTAFLPIAQAAAKVYESDCAGVTIKVTGGDSAYGLTDVRQAVASHADSAGSMISMYDGTSTDTAGLTGHPVGVLIYSIVAYTGLFPTLNISADQLRKIFISPGQPGIAAVGRRAGSGSRQAFDSTILGPNAGDPSTRNCPKPNGRSASFTSCTADSTGALLGFVNGTPNAIGYAQISGPSNSYPNVSVLSIDNATPTRDNVANGSYKYWIVEHLYAAATPTALAQDFLDFLSGYNAADLPPDYIPCVVAVNTLGAAC